MVEDEGLQRRGVGGQWLKLLGGQVGEGRVGRREDSPGAGWNESVDTGWPIRMVKTFRWLSSDSADSWWASTVATYGPGRMEDIPNLSQQEVFPILMDHPVDSIKDFCFLLLLNCLPNCEETTYTATVSAAPFRRCDFKTLGLNPLCNPAGFDDKEGGFDGMDPPMWGTSTLNQYRLAFLRVFERAMKILSNKPAYKERFGDM